MCVGANVDVCVCLGLVLDQRRFDRDSWNCLCPFVDRVGTHHQCKGLNLRIQSNAPTVISYYEVLHTLCLVPASTDTKLATSLTIRLISD